MVFTLIRINHVHPDPCSRRTPLPVWSQLPSVSVTARGGGAFDGTHIWVTNLDDDTVSKIPVG